VNLSERCIDLEAQIKSLGQAKVLASQASHFEKRADELTAVSREFAPISNMFDLLKDVKIKFQLSSDLNLDYWHSQFVSLKEKYDSDPNFILNPVPGQDARAVLLNPMKQLPSTVKAAITSEWTAWAHGQIPAINDDLIGVLASISSMKIKVERIRALKRTALEIANRLPSSKNDVDAFTVCMKDLRQAWDALAGGEIPKEVINFLRIAGSSQGADFDQLTPNVQKWFREHELEKTLRIRVT